MDHNILITRLCPLGLVFMGLYWNTLSLTCLIAVFVSNVNIVFFLSYLLLWCFPKFCSWSSSFRLHLALSCHLSLNHHLYADDTQLFFSFYPSDLEFSITHLQNALQQISSWMTANLLTFNSSRTEFLLIGLKQQLAKISSCSLDTAHSARNIFFIFDEHISFSDQISAPSKSSYSHIRQLRCIRPYLDYKTASTFATFIVHSKLQPTKYSTKPSSTHPTFSRTCCLQGPKVFPYQPCSQIFILA